MPEFSRERIKSLLQEHGLKGTLQRIVVYQAICSMYHHPTAEAVYDLLKSEHPGLSLATVYKTLDAFSQSGLVKKVATQDGLMRFDPRMDEHHHIFFKDTGEIADYSDPDLTRMVADYLKTKKINNLNIESIQLIISGTKSNNLT